MQSLSEQPLVGRIGALLPNERLLNQIVEHSSDNVVGSWEEPPNI